MRTVHRRMRFAISRFDGSRRSTAWKSDDVFKRLSRGSCKELVHLHVLEPVSFHHMPLVHGRELGGPWPILILTARES